MGGLDLKIHEKIQELQDGLESDLAEKSKQFKYRLEQKRVVFEQEALAFHRQFKISVLRFMRESQIGSIVTAPVIYSLIIPIMLSDIFITFYQFVCFPIYGIQKVKRGDYIVMDREYLPYLNLIEKINCIYCEYSNGVLSYAREIASRTEQYWCPIKHAKKMKHQPARYYDYLEYGDSKNFREGMEQEREKCRACKTPDGCPPNKAPKDV